MAAPKHSLGAGRGSPLQLNAINIELWGFRKNPMLGAMAVARALELLPPHHLEGLRKIAFEEQVTIPGLQGWIKLPGRSSHRGRYDASKHAITIHRCTSREQFFHTLFHEVGHFVYFRIITSFEKKRWVQEIYRREPAVSRYGQRNAAEDFAEAYALFTMAAASLRSRKAKFAYIKNVVFRGATVDEVSLRALVLGTAAEDDRYQLDTRV